MTSYPHVMARLLDTPLMIEPSKAEAIASVLLGRQGVEINVAADVHYAPAAGPLQERRMVQWEGGSVPLMFDAESGIAVIEVMGSLAHRQGYIGASSGVMGYDGIGAQLGEAMRRPDVRAIILDIDSPGGEVSGAFQLADRIHAAARVKPIVAIADELAASAAYLLASACTSVVLASNVSIVGSVGVITMHVSYEAMLSDAGVKPTLIFSGARKADGNPYQDLPEDVRDRIQASVDNVAAQFVSRVAAWRGMSEAAVRGTEAGIFMGADAVKIGFADEVGDPVEAFQAVGDEIRNRPALRAV